jgi:hypothetical protein
MTPMTGRLPVDAPGGTPPRRVAFNIVSGSFFDVLGIELVKGRVFDRNDRADTEPVAMVSESAAREIWPGEDPIGKVLNFYNPIGPVTRVVGVVRDAHLTSLSDKMPMLFLAAPQQMGAGVFSRTTRTVRLIGRAGNDGEALNALRSVVHAVDGGMATSRETTLTARLNDVLMPQRFGSMLLSVFSGMCLLISAVGIYAVAAFEVTRRRRELGIRAALGASRRTLMVEVMGRSGLAIAVGCVAGLGCAFASARAVQAFLFSVRPNEVTTYVVAAALLACVAALASWVPARRAGRGRWLRL